MKYFSQINALEFFKDKQLNSIEFSLSFWHSVQLLKNSWNYVYLIKWKSVSSTSTLYKNYSNLVEDLVTFLHKNKLLTKENTISITSEIIDYDSWEDSFNFDNLIWNKSSDSNLKKLSDEDITKFLDDNIRSWFVKGDKLIINMKQWSSYEREYSREIVIRLIVKFIKKLVDNKKQNKNNEINHLLSFYFEKKSQNLQIIENEWEEIISNNSSNWYVDKSLVNDTFVLCSLSDLAINETKLKIWLNKVLVRNEKISKFYFNI